MGTPVAKDAERRTLPGFETDEDEDEDDTPGTKPPAANVVTARPLHATLIDDDEDDTADTSIPVRNGATGGVLPTASYNEENRMDNTNTSVMSSKDRSMSITPGNDEGGFDGSPNTPEHLSDDGDENSDEDEVEPDFKIEDDDDDNENTAIFEDMDDEIERLIKPEPSSPEPSFDEVPVVEPALPSSVDHLPATESALEPQWASHMQLVAFRATASKIADDFMKEQDVKLRTMRLRKTVLRDRKAYEKGAEDSKKIDVHRRRIEPGPDVEMIEQRSNAEKAEPELFKGDEGQDAKRWLLSLWTALKRSGNIDPRAMIDEMNLLLRGEPAKWADTDPRVRDIFEEDHEATEQDLVTVRKAFLERWHHNE